MQKFSEAYARVSEAVRKSCYSRHLDEKEKTMYFLFLASSLGDELKIVNGICLGEYDVNYYNDPDAKIIQKVGIATNAKETNAFRMITVRPKSSPNVYWGS
jgi:hypothetical protein